MMMNYITKIKSNITIHTSKKTTNILDGAYKSIYKGRSMHFEDLREYVIGDNIKDIDWKASARSNQVLIRQYIAEKKHNVMFVMDTGKKMLADTKDMMPKKYVLEMVAGILAYISEKNGNYVGAIYGKEDTVALYRFKSGLYNIENILTNYEKDVEKENTNNLQKCLEYIEYYTKKRMIIFVITDLEGMESVKFETLKRLSVTNDVMFINISDAYMIGENAFDIESDFYIPKMFLKDKKLFGFEKETKEKIYRQCEERLRKFKIPVISISNDKEIVKKIIELLEKYKFKCNC